MIGESLKKLNSFGVDVYAYNFYTIQSYNDIIDFLKKDTTQRSKIMVLGSGSNILFTKNYEGVILYNNILGIETINESEKSVIVSVGSGVVWHDFVIWSLNKNLSGIENLALIPGTVGASPIQNIGAYGVEVKNFIKEIEYVDLKNGELKKINNKSCKFSYRDSIFKNELKDSTFITRVTFKLSKEWIDETSYGEIIQELKSIKKESSPKNIAEAVINIRRRKLPDVKEIGNAGSFFKNPIISNKKFSTLKDNFPTIIGYPVSKEETKVAAGWLIDHIGLKGYRKGDAGVHSKQALVLVNHGNATGLDILNLAIEIQRKIKYTYDIDLEFEVNII